MKISVAGLFRDSEQYIKTTLSLLDDLSKTTELDFYFYENDSIDNTKNILSEWMTDKKGEVINETINAPKFGSVPNVERLILLSYYRNKVKGLLNNSQSKYCLLIDTDIVFTTQDFIFLYNFLENHTNAAMVVSNTRQYQIEDLMNYNTHDSFYDVFALRDEFNNNCLYFTDCPFVLDKHRKQWINNEPIRINSGFGGFALIRTDVLKDTDCAWSTCGHSEHINFCTSVSRHGGIYMLPYCKPKTEINISSINIESCKKTAKKQLQYIKNINYLYNLSLTNSITIK